MNTDYDAIVIGAGPAGATTAIRLAEAGWSVALVEKRDFPRRKVCGECIAATNLPLLDALGVGDAFRKIAGPELRRVGLFVGEREIVAPLPPLNAVEHRWGRALGREHLDTLLLERAAEVGASIWQPWTVKREEHDGARHACVLVRTGGSDTVRLRAPVLVRAHGSWEPEPDAQTQTGARAPHRDGDLFAFKGTYRDARIEPGLLPVLAFSGGYGGMVLGDHGLTTVAFCVRRDTLRAQRALHPGRKAALAALEHVQRQCAGARDALADATQAADWLAAGPIQPGIHSPWRADGSFAVGNLAGEAHPIFGEGISMAIQSAWLLCDRLLAQPTRPSTPDVSPEQIAGVGRDYARRWRRQFAPRIRLAAVCAHLAMRPQAAGALLPLLQRSPGLLTLCARAAGKVRQPAITQVARIIYPHPNGARR
jgi:flavin-dependent dehydrogenase